MSKVEGVLGSRGWESIFFASEALMIILFCVGTTMEAGLHSHTTDATVL